MDSDYSFDLLVKDFTATHLRTKGDAVAKAVRQDFAGFQNDIICAPLRQVYDETSVTICAVSHV